jgi:hypothetical protein
MSHRALLNDSWFSFALSKLHLDGWLLKDKHLFKILLQVLELWRSLLLLDH